MSAKTRNAVIFVAVAYFLGWAAVLATPARAATIEVTSILEKDTFVSEWTPNGNFGDDSDLYVGNKSGYWYEIYLAFNLSSRPANWKTCELVLFNNSLNVNFTTINARETVSADWDEMAITWNTRPALTGTTYGCSIQPEPRTPTSEVNRISINLLGIAQAYAKADANTKISIGLNVTAPTDSFIFVYSIDETFTPIPGINRKPMIRWTYEELDWWVYVVAAGVAGGVFCLVIVFWRKRKGAKPKGKPGEAAAVTPGDEKLEFGD